MVAVWKILSTVHQFQDHYEIRTNATSDYSATSD